MNVVNKSCFLISKYLWAPKRSWKIFNRVLVSPGFLSVKEWEPCTSLAQYKAKTVLFVNFVHDNYDIVVCPQDFTIAINFQTANTLVIVLFLLIMYLLIFTCKTSLGSGTYSLK